ncbi:LacI family DNA-binding transcriptional regulator [Yoonia sp. MH D7]
MKSNKVTIVDVARLAKVSTATAGRVLGRYGYAGGETKERVLKVAQELGYRPNELARGLITGRTRTIGVIAGDISSPFYASVLRGISDVIEGQGLGLLITNSDETLSREISAAKLLSEKQIDGLIVAPCDVTSASHLHDVVAAGIPVVLVDRKVRNLNVDSVAVENVDSSRDAVARLLAAGHLRIGIVVEYAGALDRQISDILAYPGNKDGPDPSPMSTGKLRLRGYLEAHKAAGVVVDPGLIISVTKHSAQAACDAVVDNWARKERPTAVFCADGLMSAGTMLAIASLHRRVPEDLSIIGFDDLDWMRFVGTGIDAVAQPRKLIGRAAARLLLARIGGATGYPRNMLLSPKYRQRNSIKLVGENAESRAQAEDSNAGGVGPGLLH